MFDNPFVTNIENFFFKAMAQGWVADGKKFIIPQLPHYKAIEHRDGDFHLIDCYCKNLEHHGSIGFTTIYYKSFPVWTMHYGGEYITAEAINFLKQTLSVAYRRRHFFGGRGPWSFCGENMIYINTAKKNNFANFSGSETIHDTKTGQLYGYHDYQGMTLF